MFHVLFDLNVVPGLHRQSLIPPPRPFWTSDHVSEIQLTSPVEVNFEDRALLSPSPAGPGEGEDVHLNMDIWRGALSCCTHLQGSVGQLRNVKSEPQTEHGAPVWNIWQGLTRLDDKQAVRVSPQHIFVLCRHPFRAGRSSIDINFTVLLRPPHFGGAALDLLPGVSFRYSDQEECLLN